MKQNDLDILLAEFRQKNPGELRVQKWKKAVRAQVLSTARETANQAAPAAKNRFWLQLIAAMVVGFIVGGVYFRDRNTESELLTKYNSNDATYDFTYTKSE
jgi:hypothetical protein